jgi:hypothetical protein
MKLTNKELDKAEEKADEFFESIDGLEVGVVGLAIIFIAGGFLIDVTNDRDAAMEGLGNLCRDVEAAINEAYPKAH